MTLQAPTLRPLLASQPGLLALHSLVVLFLLQSVVH
jgi:hypothetical protein